MEEKQVTNECMIDITAKNSTLRTARAQAIIKVGSASTMDRLKNKSVPKGDVLEVSRTAGLFAVKKTSDLIPDCHPIPIESTRITFSLEGLEIRVEVEVKTIYKTGVEVEAMHGASVVALTIYDMLKPIDKNIVIGPIHLLEKTGGKSSFQKFSERKIVAGILVCSDRASAGKQEDKSGELVRKKLEALSIGVLRKEIIPDEAAQIEEKVNAFCKDKINLLIVTGGTGLSKRDVAPETIRNLFDREIPGIMETARQYGQARMPFAMLSRSVAGIIGNTLVLTFPGSEKACEEYMDALFPGVIHVFGILEGGSH